MGYIGWVSRKLSFLVRWLGALSINRQRLTRKIELFRIGTVYYLACYLYCYLACLAGSLFFGVRANKHLANTGIGTGASLHIIKFVFHPRE